MAANATLTAKAADILLQRGTKRHENGAIAWFPIYAL